MASESTCEPVTKNENEILDDEIERLKKYIVEIKQENPNWKKESCPELMMAIADLKMALMRKKGGGVKIRLV